jgi:hypothetical protein
MGLLISILIFLMLGLAIFQAWQLWYMRREVARLEQRLAESLDDQDLLEFQDRLKGLLAETKDAGLRLVQIIEQRQAAVEKVIAQAVEAEKRLSVRAQLLELAARELTKTPTLPAKASPSNAKKRPLKKPAPKAVAPKPVEVEKEPAKAARESAAQEEARRSYLSRAGATHAPNGSGASPRQRVYELADQGLDREQIAREAGILAGEVELILNLRPGKRGSK